MDCPLANRADRASAAFALVSPRMGKDPLTTAPRITGVARTSFISQVICITNYLYKKEKRPHRCGLSVLNYLKPTGFAPTPPR